MDSEYMFDIYSAHEAPKAPSSKKKTSKRHPEESSKMPQAKKACTAGPLSDGPSANATPPPSPLETDPPPAPAGSTPSPPAPTDQTQQAGPASTRGDISSRALRSVKDRVAKFLKHDRCREAMASTETMDVDQILTRALSDFASLEAVLEEKNKLAAELREKQTALDEAVEQRDQFKDSTRINYRKAKKLEQELAASRQETTTLEGRIEKLEQANASNVERYKNAMSKCLYDFWKHKQGADFSYLPDRARHAKIAHCVARLAEEERARARLEKQEEEIRWLRQRVPSGNAAPNVLTTMALVSIQPEGGNRWELLKIVTKYVNEFDGLTKFAFDFVTMDVSQKE
ncbi:uncharacterized protein LOC133806901 [Humulus lupulus]|uniref:uncharacterized protein LOC133806901 n=1 Tax=Humulus lupulus TaxID=3486 RepID=UPI002B40E28F|nr:uncharacterized protein LOC133806901 [Humulus lupulus]